MGTASRALARPVAWHDRRRGKEVRREAGAEPVARARARLSRPVHGRAGCNDRERRAAVDSGCAPFHPDEPAVDRQCLHAHVRRLPAARRPRLRPARPPAALHRRDLRVHRGIPDQRRRPVLRRADRGPRPAGAWRRARLARGARNRHHDLRRRRRAHEGARGLERDRGRRRCCRPRDRRFPHRDAVVALDLLRQPPDRHRSCAPVAAFRAELAAGRPSRDLRRRRRRDGHRRSAGARLRDRQGPGLRLGLVEDRWPVRARFRACSPHSSSSNAVRKHR